MKEPLSHSVSITELRRMREEEHLTNVEIAKRLDVHPATIGRYLGPYEMNTRSRKHGRKPVTPDMVDTMRRLYQEGRSINSIAERLDVGWETVKKCVRGTGNAVPVAMEPECPVDTEPAAVEAPAEPDVQEERSEEPMFSVISKRQTIRLQGADCQYELELGSGNDSVTIINGSTEVIMFDAASLRNFISELEQLERQYMKEGVMADG